MLAKVVISAYQAPQVRLYWVIKILLKSRWMIRWMSRALPRYK